MQQAALVINYDLPANREITFTGNLDGILILSNVLSMALALLT